MKIIHTCQPIALSISGPGFRMDLNRARSLAPKLKQACAAISLAARG